MDELVSFARGLGAVAALLAAILWFWGSRIVVPDNIDTFISVLQRIVLPAKGAEAYPDAAHDGFIRQNGPEPRIKQP